MKTQRTNVLIRINKKIQITRIEKTHLEIKGTGIVYNNHVLIVYLGLILTPVIATHFGVSYVVGPSFILEEYTLSIKLLYKGISHASLLVMLKGKYDNK